MSEGADERKDEVVQIDAEAFAEAFIPDEIQSFNPDGCNVQVHPSGRSVMLAFFLYGSKKIVNINLTAEAAAAVRLELPATTAIITPPAPQIILAR